MPEESHVRGFQFELGFVGFAVWVRGFIVEFVGFGFCCLGSSPGFASLWVRWLGFQYFDLLFSIFRRLWLSWIFFFQREKRKKKRLRCFVDCGCRGFFFFLRGRRGRRRLRFSWGSFVEIECLILEFHVNFNNRVCDTRFATMNSSPSASRC